MTWIAGVEADPLSRGVRVILGRETYENSLTVVTAITGEAPTTEQHDRYAMTPALHMPVEMARALLDALAAHFHGTSEVRQLRKDYDAERHRVDKLTEAVVTIATGRPA